VFHAREPEADHVDAVVVAVLQLHIDEKEGDFLVFLAGQEEIEDVAEVLARKRKLLPTGSMDYCVVKMFAALPGHMQSRVFEKVEGGARKIVLATNIAETSITIPGIKIVVDSGAVKERVYDPRTGMESLRIVKVSKSAALQRMGRAGRESAGKTFRLYTIQEFNEMQEFAKPDITRNNLSSVVLSLKVMGRDARFFSFLDRPEDLFIDSAYDELKRLGAVDKQEKLTTLGRNIAELPLPPILARILLASLEPSLQCTKEILTIIALLSVENLCYVQSKEENAMRVFRANEGDHITLLKIFNEWKKNKSKEWCKTYGINSVAMKRVKMVRKQLKGYLKKYKPVWKKSENETVIKCLSRGLFHNSAFLQPDNTHYRAYRTKEMVFIHPTSVLFQNKHKPQSIIFSEIIVTSKKYVRTVSEADPVFLESLIKTLG
jgi:HrpA-like RNA helicase